jgi:small subunit ribosomal protein S1
MGSVPDGEDSRTGLASIQVGDLCSGTVVAVTRSGELEVALDGFPARPLGVVGPLDLGWPRPPRAKVKVGDRITAAVIAVDAGQGRVRLSIAAVRNRELWMFLSGLRRGEVVSGVVAAIERFGVFVALDDGPGHPVFPGVGFITIPELSWDHIDSAADVVQVGRRVSCEFLQFDISNGEARLSLRAMQPDPVKAFLDEVTVGQALRGPVTKLAPFGAFVRVADGVEGLVHLRELAGPPVAALDEVLRVGDEITVAVTGIDRARRRLTLSQRAVSADLPCGHASEVRQNDQCLTINETASGAIRSNRWPLRVGPTRGCTAPLIEKIY